MYPNEAKEKLQDEKEYQWINVKSYNARYDDPPTATAVTDETQSEEDPPEQGNSFSNDELLSATMPTTVPVQGETENGAHLDEQGNSVLEFNTSEFRKQISYTQRDVRNEFPQNSSSNLLIQDALWSVKRCAWSEADKSKRTGWIEEVKNHFNCWRNAIRTTMQTTAGDYQACGRCISRHASAVLSSLMVALSSDTLLTWLIKSDRTTDVFRNTWDTLKEVQLNRNKLAHQSTYRRQHMLQELSTEENLSNMIGTYRQCLQDLVEFINQDH